VKNHEKMCKTYLPRSQGFERFDPSPSPPGVSTIPPSKKVA
jgi:hypothetical protein